ncbi:hypothetical protein [Rubellimicrobium mesophilum]|uniref:hypothetical protein n=1 Tax=Rubellimicrobium mesophilum TaxID=1123067 RepID=UPI0012E160C8|nr:hypothetical protein [Rubellimicrobium mesophilum]
MLAYVYDRRAGGRGTIARVDVYARDSRLRIDRELSRLATRAAWALGWPLPAGERGPRMMVPDPAGLTSEEREEAIRHVEAAMAAAPPEILARPVRTADEPQDEDLGDVEAVAAWLDYRHPGRIERVVVQYDLFERLRNRVREAARRRVPLASIERGPGAFRAVEVNTLDGVEDAALNEEARQALVALGWRHEPGLPETPWWMGWRPAVMSEGFKAQAVERVRQALGGAEDRS